MANPNVRFTVTDDDDDEPRQDPIEVEKLRNMRLQDPLGPQQPKPLQTLSGPSSASVSRSTSELHDNAGLAAVSGSRRSSRADIFHGSHSRIHSPDISPPATPRGDPNDPYRRSARVPQSKSLADIAPQFIFQKHVASTHSSHTHLKDFFHSHHEKTEKGHKSHSGFDIGRFFRHGGKRSGTSTPTSSASSVYMPEFDSKVPKKVKGDDHVGLHQKYGKAGKLLGAGAGGSVRIMKRSVDGQLFAVKEFRERGSTETLKEYNKKVTAEFCVASAMHHPNVIETLEVLRENAKWYQVMEYAPFDMFAIVMTGKMARPEIFCCFKQLLRGVEYLHGMGLAHRDLKLDNLVVDEHGIVKIIDFGSAIVFKYPFEEEIHEATGIVGSDPYLSPETCTNIRYSPEPADIWSCAVIFCCMCLRRFPWKSPRLSDNSFKSFAMSDPLSEEKCKPDVLRHAPTEQQVPSSSSNPQPIIRGPWRLLRLLPKESRAVIKGMLELEPEKRFSMHDIVLDDWVQSIEMCYADKHTGTYYQSAGHTHHLIGPEAQKK